jgi:4'-phosphopantetheinyl transferase
MEGRVQVWRTELAAVPPLTALLPLLGADERARAARFRGGRDRLRFCAARAMLRLLLATYSGQAAMALRFNYGAHGKPSLADAPDLYFNLSHAHEQIILAVAEVAVGIDVEYRRELALEQLAARFFCAPEAAHLAELPHSARHAAFLRLWTCKEAYLKATGEGLGNIRQACIEFDVHARPCLRDLRLGADNPWRLHLLPMGADYIAALAIKGDLPYHLYSFAWSKYT